MDRPKQLRGALLTSNLPQLQNLIKRDPPGYHEEFLQQWNHYDSILNIFRTNPDDHHGAERFRELVTFIAQVAQCYPQETKDFPTQLSTLLLEQYETLNSEIRKALVQNLVLLRNKDVITSIEYVPSRSSIHLLLTSFLFPVSSRLSSPSFPERHLQR